MGSVAEVDLPLDSPALMFALVTGIALPATVEPTTSLVAPAASSVVHSRMTLLVHSTLTSLALEGLVVVVATDLDGNPEIGFAPGYFPNLIDTF